VYDSVEKILVCYSFKDLVLKERNQLRRELYGSVESTKGGKYTSEFIGFLTGKKYEKPARCVIVISKIDLEGVLTVLKKYRAIVTLYAVTPIHLK
jgi:hypothetical protein